MIAVTERKVTERLVTIVFFMAEPGTGRSKSGSGTAEAGQRIKLLR
jgi:hypothetical protein